ncbi:MAG: energy transducer TonB, partial [Terriglobia bacterium]
RLEIEDVPGNNSSGPPNPNPNPALSLPKPSLEELARSAARPNGAGGIVVGDTGENLPDIPGLNQPSSQCRVCSTLQLKSDPQKVDFKPYLIKVISIVKRNWLAVVPESARLGRRDSVVVEFSIDRSGSIPKLVIVSGAGVEAFNRAAVAGLSASVPLPPLPAEYKGDQIVLDMTFLYNIARR